MFLLFGFSVRRDTWTHDWQHSSDDVVSPLLQVNEELQSPLPLMPESAFPGILRAREQKRPHGGALVGLSDASSKEETVSGQSHITTRFQVSLQQLQLE